MHTDVAVIIIIIMNIITVVGVCVCVCCSVGAVIVPVSMVSVMQHNSLFKFLLCELYAE